MRIRLVVAGVALLLLPMAPASPALAAEPVEVLVKVKPGAEVVGAATAAGGEVTKEIAPRTVKVTVEATSAEAAVARIAERTDIEWAEPNVGYRASRTANDPCYVSTCAGYNVNNGVATPATLSQWGPAKINAPAAWDVTVGDSALKVAVLDSGVDAGHPDLAGRIRVGPKFSGEVRDDDGLGHGTHVAGVIGAATNNGVGVAGMAWSVDMTSVKVLDSTGYGSADTVAPAIRWAADNGMRIINMSFGGPSSRAIEEAVNYASSRGSLMVGAADNQGSPIQRYPAAYPQVLSVGATDQSDARASYSNYGRWVDITAPGTGIVSTWPRSAQPTNPYVAISGTSMATPFVAATAALYWAEHPYASPAGVTDRLMRTATPISGSGTFTASGRLDAGAALAPTGQGYRLAAADGGIFNYGASFNGSAGGQKLNRPIVAVASTGSSDGYWLFASDGGVFSYGDARFYGSTGGVSLNRPIVGAARSAFGAGYWLVASDGGVFSFGDAPFYGSTGGMTLNRPIVAMVSTATGRGYWLVASDGGVFSYGDARFYGSTGGTVLNQPIVGAARSATGNGYWLVASDGGIFAYGDARFQGSTGAKPLNRPIVGMSPSPSGGGYWLVASDGGVFSFGDSVFRGSAGGAPINSPVIGISGTP